jgi:hypothetical protein
MTTCICQHYYLFVHGIHTKVNTLIIGPCMDHNTIYIYWSMRVYNETSTRSTKENQWN